MIPSRALPRRSLLATLGLSIVLLISLAGLAHGERSQRGNLIASLDSQFSPLKLPRHQLAPVTVSISGSVSSADGSTLPRVKQIELDLAGSSLFFTRGLPTCPLSKIHNVNNALALARCRPALVGRGRMDGQVFVEHQHPFAINAQLLAFNGRQGGAQAIWVHAYAPSPPISFVIPFVVHNRSGHFGTELLAKMPGSVGAAPHAAEFALTVGRRFRYGGVLRSYLNASCPAPRHFTAGFFAFARVTYTLAGGQQAGTEAVRSCRVR